MNAAKAFQVSFTAGVLRDAYNEGAINNTAFGNLRWRFADEFGLTDEEREVFFSLCREEPDGPAPLPHYPSVTEGHSFRDPDAAD